MDNNNFQFLRHTPCPLFLLRHGKPPLQKKLQKYERTLLMRKFLTKFRYSHELSHLVPHRTIYKKMNEFRFFLEF